MHDEANIDASSPVGAESELQDRLLLLVGARRSGTNWLERVLTTHPEIVAMPSETYLFSHGLRPLSELFQHASPGQRLTGKTYMERRAFLEAARGFMDRVLLEAMQRFGADAQYLLERTPWHAQHLDLIAAVYPDARVIHLIRDGRSVARSLQSMPWGPETIAEAAAEWRDAVVCRKQGENLFGDRYTEIRYEELLNGPVSRAAGLFDWLGLEASEKLLAQVESEAATSFNVDPGAPEIRDDKWQTELSRGDLEEIERIAGAELALLGYAEQGRARTAASESPRFRLLRGRPVRPRREARRRQLAREAQAKRVEHLGLVERFGDLVSQRRYGEARRLCSADGWYRLIDDGQVTEGRGADALDAFLAALARHHDSGLTPISSNTHASPRWFTTIHTYRRDAGDQWTQTIVFEADGGLITSAALYRYELQAD